jgi:hypothetical protein
MIHCLAVHYVIGDTHGCFQSLVRLLQREGFIGNELEWTGGQAQLWFLGDYTDRGPNGIGVIELLMRLEHAAPAAGGAVHALLGNHDLMLLAAHHFTDTEIPSFKRQGQRVTFYEIWQRVGGKEHDLERLNEAHIEWLSNRPALALVENTLLMHADSLFYLEWGESLEQINRSLCDILHSDSVESWDVLAEQFAGRFAFLNGGIALTEEFLGQLGGHRLVHGHTPIYSLIGYAPQMVLYPLEYNDGLCFNVDHCLWNGGPGFVFNLAENL